MIQRQRRIAERSSSKKTGLGNKNSSTLVKNAKPKVHPSSEETKKIPKPVLRNSTIERLATARVSQNVSPIQAKSVPTKKQTLTGNGVPSQKTAGAKKKVGPKEVNSSNKKDDKKNINAQTQLTMEAPVVLPVKHSAVQPVEPNDSIVRFKDIMESSPVKNAGHLISERESMPENVTKLDLDSSVPNQVGAFRGNLSRVEVSDKVSSVPSEDNPGKITGAIINPTEASSNKVPAVSVVNLKANHEIHEHNPVSPKRSAIEVSTPPPRVMPEPVHSRKKWSSDEDSSKAAKGFRKLLFFGRKS